MTASEPSSSPSSIARRRAFIVILAAAVILAASLAYVLTAVRAGSTAPSLIGGPFNLVDQRGQPLAEVRQGWPPCATGSSVSLGCGTGAGTLRGRRCSSACLS